MNLFCIMLVNSKYMDIFPTSFAFFSWNKTLSDCRVFQMREKDFSRKTGKFPFFPHLSSSLDQIILCSLFGLRGSSLCCVNWLIKIY